MADTYTEQERVWGILYARLEKILRQFGKSDYLCRADYWLLDDNWGPKQHKLYITNLNMLAPRIVKLLQAALTEYPDWEIIAAVALERKSWPEMGLTIRAHEIIDNLQRQYFPKEFQAIAYKENPLG
ncbi:MAG: hypothetical protein WB499_17650 [Pseudolabrys sp.]